MAYTTIDNPELYFQTKLYTGNGGTQSITNTGNSDLQPDWVWIKQRTATQSHVVFDVVRGVGKALVTNTTAAEDTQGNAVTSFNTDGFSLGDGSSANSNSETYVAWQWKAGGSASSNSNGSITSSVSASTDAGFSIVSYTGTGSTGTVGHGLGATPSMIIIKERNNSTSWIVYHHKNTSAPATDYLLLNSTQATDDYADYFNDTEPTSSVFTIDTAGDINGSSDTYIAYCFAEKKGFSKFGSYTGNGNADGTFIYTGFKPAFFMLKRTNGTEDWVIYDNKRDPINKAERILRPNATNAESTSFFADILSNGFKLRMASEAKVNGSGDTYIYMAFAESPFVTSTGIPTTAR